MNEGEVENREIRKDSGQVKNEVRPSGSAAVSNAAVERSICEMEKEDYKRNTMRL